MRKEGMAIPTIGMLILAIIGVILFLSLVFLFPSFSNAIYCNTFVKISLFFSSISGNPTSLPEVCKNEKIAIYTETLSETNATKVGRYLLGYAIKCYEEGQIESVTEEKICLELKLENNLDERIDERFLTYLLKKESDCERFENSDYGCGELDQLLWDIDGKLNIYDYSKYSSIITSSIKPNLKISFSIPKLKTRFALKRYLEKDFPKQICKEKGKCTFNISEDIVTLKIGKNTYTYDIFEILSKLDKEGLTSSFIKNQKTITFTYLPNRDAVMLSG